MSYVESANSPYSDKLFAFDIGTNSIGWCVYATDKMGEPNRIEDIGARIFSDGRDAKSGASLAVARREARQMRRMRDRYLRRRDETLRLLTEYGLMPTEEAARIALLKETSDRRQKSDTDSLPADPYNLRARALSEKLPLHYFGRALFHLGQRRGFKSNRKTDSRDTNEKGKIAMGVEELQGAMRDARAPTLGAYLAARKLQGKIVRIRQGSEAFTGDKQDNYLFYPERAMLEDEFKKIWDAQAEYYPDILNEARKEQLFHAIFYQRPLKEPEIGYCAFNFKLKEKRLPKAHPLFQEFRLYKEVNELRIITAESSKGRALTKDERDKIIKILRPAKQLSFAKMAAAIKLKTGKSFNKYDKQRGRTDLAGDEIYSLMVSGKKIKGEDREYFGNQWADFPREKQWDIIKHLRDEQDPEKLDKWLSANFPSLSDKQRENIANAKLPEGYGRLGEKALSEMLEEMKADVIPESEAAERCSYTHNLLDKKREGCKWLPPYQEVDAVARSIPPGTDDPDDSYDKRKGRITNPTVHIALNQLRRIVNALLRKHGKPQRMAVELARNLQLSDKQKEKLNKEIGANTRAAIKRSELLQEMNAKDNGYNRLIIKLWQELGENPTNRLCPYSGKPISAAMLFSAEVDIDHILPYSRTLDDNQANKVLCLKEANREKRNRPPAEVTEWGEKRYDEILDRAENLPKSKRWRFARDAMQQFEERGGFLARQLTDTQYICRLARAYLDALYPGQEEDFDHKTGELLGDFGHKYHIRAIPGRLTELLRRNWGLNSLLPDYQIVLQKKSNERGESESPSEEGGNPLNKPKNRNDHRHHAIDAAVIGVTTGGMLQRIAKASGVMEARAFDDFIKKTVKETLPWPDFRRDLQAVIERIIVSHKPDHGTLPKKQDIAKGKGQTAAKLMKETAYGLPADAEGVRLKDAKGNNLVVWRVPFLGLKAKDLDSLRDPHLQSELRDYIYAETGGLKDGKEFETALLKFRGTHKQYKGIRHVRIIAPRNVIEIKDKSGKAYKGYWNDGNYRYDVWQTLDGKWQSEIISMFDAHRTDWQSEFHAKNPTAKKVLSLQQNDMVAYQHQETGERVIARVAYISGNGQIAFAPHNEANVDARNRDDNDPFKYFIRVAGALQKLNCRQIRVDEIGQVFDPGFGK